MCPVKMQEGELSDSGLRLDRLRVFTCDMARLIKEARDEEQIIAAGGRLLAKLVRRDDWLPPTYAEPDPMRYRQFLLHCDSLERFSVVAFVWGPGQSTPVHDHTIWGLIGMLRGSEVSQSYCISNGVLVSMGPPSRLMPGQVAAVSPEIGDIHHVANAYADRVSISIHVYGGNIGAIERSTYDSSGNRRRFISGYVNAALPNFWRIVTQFRDKPA